MRVVQAAHSWRRVSEDWEGQHSFSKLTVREGGGFKQSEVSLDGGACLVAGVNSGGKSRLIKSIYAEFSDSQQGFTSVEWRGDRPPSAVFVDFFDLLMRESNFFQVPDLTEMVESAGLVPVKARTLKNINWVLGREYKDIQLAEVDNPNLSVDGENDWAFRSDVVPYFRVQHRSGEVFYSEQLSRGELAVLTLSWVLESLKSGSLMLFDEPDLMLSPHSSQRAIDLLVSKVNDLKSPAFIATHSYHTLASVPDYLLVHINVTLEGYSLASRPDGDTLWKTLKVSAPVRVIFVVEDEMAKFLLNALLADYVPHYKEISEVWIAGDASRVTRAGQFPQSKGQTLQIWGVLDGNEADPDPRYNLLRLPGGMSPEEGALMVLERHPEAFEIGDERATELLGRYAGVNPHDSLHQIAEELGMDSRSLTTSAWRWWLKNEEDGQRELQSFKSELLDRVDIGAEPS